MASKRKISDDDHDFDEPHQQDDDEDAELGAAAIIVPPDGGWGWMIVLASFTANMIVDGIIFTAGSGFQKLWRDEFKAGEGEVAWVVSLLSGCYLLVGPIASALVNIFGCRRVCISGTLLAFLGFILSYFAPSVAFLYFTFGIMGGIGFGFIFLPSVVIVSYYFEKKRATATGISLCGSGIGTFLFAPFIKFLLEHYQWNQALLVLAGITLNGLVCGSLYRSLQPSKRQIQTLEEKLKAIDEEQEVDIVVAKTSIVNGKPEEIAHEPKENTQLLATNVAFERFNNDPISRQKPSTAQDDARTGLRQRTVSNKSFRSLFETNTSTGLMPTVDRGHGRGLPLSIRVDGTGSHMDIYRKISREGVSVLNRPLSRQDIFYTGSVQNLPDYKAQPDVPHYIASTLTLTGADGAGDTAGPVVTTGVKETIKATLRSMLDMSLLRDPNFLILAFSGFFTLTGFFVPFIYLPRQAESKGHTPEMSTFLVSILGITNIVARLLCGWLSDRPWVNALMMNNVALILAGIATILLPFFQPYWLLCIYCVIFGTGTACFASLRSIICVELLGLKKLTNAFGLLLMFMGVASLIGSPIAGALRDMTGNFDVSFYVMGTLITISGAMGIPLYMKTCLKNRREREYKVGLHAPDVVVDEATELTAPVVRVQIPERVPEETEEMENIVA